MNPDTNPNCVSTIVKVHDSSWELVLWKKVNPSLPTFPPPNTTELHQALPITIVRFILDPKINFSDQFGPSMNLILFYDFF